MSKPRGLPVAAFLIILILSPLSGFAAETAADATRTADIKPELLENLSWREIGPAVMGGRVTDLAVLESNPATFYAATATGGLWKTTNHGTTWQPLFEDEEVSSIGDVTLAPSNPNIIWVGTGEANNRQSSPWGKGVYKSVDGGRSWELTGLEETRHVARIPDPSQQSEYCLCGCSGASLGTESRKGRLPHPGWRKDLAQSSLY